MSRSPADAICLPPHLASGGLAARPSSLGNTSTSSPSNPARRIGYIKGKVERNAAWALIVASIAPPPFPFTPFIMAAAALQYPRKKMLAITTAARMVRFTALGALALVFGRRILRWAASPAVQYVLIALIVVCIVGSVISVVGWVKRSRQPAATQAG